MKSVYALLGVALVGLGIYGSACVSGDTVSGGSGGRTGSNTGNGGSNSPGLGGFVGAGLGGSNNPGMGGFVGGGGLGGFVGGGQGGTPVTGGQGGSTLPSGPCTVPATSPIIDDVEKAPNGTAQGCVHGYWYTYNDGSAGTQTPPSASWMGVAITDRPPSTFAIHSTASGFTGDNQPVKNLFAGFGLDLNPAPAPSPMKFTVNASAFKGITFFAKGSGTINVNIPTSVTDPSLGCTVMCYDTSFKAITLTATWTQYNLLWTDFAQAGFSTVKETLTGMNIGGIKFEGKATAPATFPAFDAWIDDLKFIQ
jgi:hypothetical protein